MSETTHLEKLKDWLQQFLDKENLPTDALQHNNIKAILSSIEEAPE